VREHRFRVYLTTLAIVCAGVWVASVITQCVLPPPQDALPSLFANLRFILLLALLLLLSWEAIRGYVRHIPAVPVSPQPAQALVDPITSMQQPGWSGPRAQVFIGCLVLTGLLAIRAMTATPFLCDEGIWNYVAHAWRHFGLLPYLGTLENKTPGIFYLFYLSDLCFGVTWWFPRLLGVITTGLTGWGIYALAARVRGHATGMAALTIFGLTSTSNMMGAQASSETETFMIGFTVLAANLLFIALRSDQPRRSVRLLLLVGLCLGGAIAFKQVAIFSVAGLCCLYFSLRPPARTGAMVIRDLSLVAAGVLLATALSLVPLLLNHVHFCDYLHGAWTILSAPGSSAPSLEVRFARANRVLETVDFQLFLPMILVLLALYGTMKKQALPIAGLIGWLLCEFVAANASGAYFGHQMRQFLPPLALVAALTLATLVNWRWSGQALSSPYPALFGVIVITLWFPCWLTDDHREKDDALWKTVHWIDAHTTPRDYVYTVTSGDGTPVLAFAQRPAPSRHFTQYFLGIPGGEEELRRDLTRRPPSYLLLPVDKLMSSLPTREVSPWLIKMAKRDYQLETTITYPLRTTYDKVDIGFYVYRRIRSMHQ